MEGVGYRVVGMAEIEDVVGGSVSGWCGSSLDTKRYKHVRNRRIRTSVR
jgi:hypothetical protein